MGLREEKKARTRKLISDLATQMFMERGYAEVTLAEIAEAAEVSVPTLFNYFANKESLVFDEDEAREASLLAAVKERERGVSILDALVAHLDDVMELPPSHAKHAAAFRKMIASTPELAAHAKETWLRYETSLAKAIREETKEKTSALEAAAIARFILDAFHRSSDERDPRAAFRTLLGLLKSGWRA